MKAIVSVLVVLFLISGSVAEAHLALPSDYSESDNSKVSPTRRVSDSAIRLEVDNATPMVGDQITVTLTIDNTSTASGGPFDIFNVETGLVLPTGLSFVSVTPDPYHSCSTSGGEMTCTAQSFPAGSEEDIIIIVDVNETGEFIVTGTTTHDAFDPDSGNNEDTITIVSSALGSIAGTVFEDLNANGTLDDGEPVKADVPVVLSGAASASTRTDANGNYVFTGLEAGSYTVTVEVITFEDGTPGDWHASNPASGRHNIDLAEGEAREGLDFLIWQEAIINILVFHDEDKNGNLNGSERLLNGLTVIRLDDCGLSIAEEQTSMVVGRAIFDGLQPGTYCFRVKGGQTFPGAAVGQDVLISRPAEEGGLQQRIVEVESGAEESSNFLVYTHGEISVSKLLDADGDGEVDSEDVPLEGWTIQVKDNENNVVASGVTGADGTLTLGEIEPGDYQVEEVDQEDWSQTFPASPAHHPVELRSDERVENLVFMNKSLRSDVAITKTVSPSLIAQDDTVTVTLTVSNVSSTAAENVTAEDSISDFFEFVSVSTTKGTCSESDRTVTCAVGGLAPGESQVISITTIAVKGGDTSNTGTVSTSSTDTNPENNSSIVEITIHPVDLSLTLVSVQHQTCANGLLDVDRETTDGNRVIITVAVTNGSEEISEAVTLNFTEKGTGKILNDGTGTLSGVVPPMSSVLFEYTWNTTGWAWDDSEQAYTISRIIQVVLTRKGDPFGAVEKSVLVKPKPVILVHGLWSNAAAWSGYPAFANNQHANYAGRVTPVAGMDTGLFPVSAFLEPSAMHQMFTKTTISENAASLDAYVQTVRKSTNSCHVDIVAHSMGGLISRHWIHNSMPTAEPDGERLLRHLVQLGTPNEGSPCADDIMAMYPSLVADDNSFSSIFQRTRPPNNVIELTTTHVKTSFNQQVNNYKGVPIFLAYGNKFFFTCRALDAGDSVVAVKSATATETSNPIFTGVQEFNALHTDMPGDQGMFDGFVKPILSEPPGGGAQGHLPPPDNAGHPFIAAKGSVDGEEYILTESSFVENGVEKVIDIPIETASSFGVTYLTAADVESSLLNPGGQQVASVDANSPESQVGLRAHTIENPASGTWRLTLNQSVSDSSGLMAAAWVIGSDVNLGLSVENASEPNHVLVTAEFSDGGAPILSASVEATAVAEEGTSRFTLLDDGQNGDGMPGDGIYSALFRPEQPGAFLFSATAIAGSNTRTRTISHDVTGISGVDVDRIDDTVPRVMALGAPYPNPVQSMVRLPVLVSRSADVDIRLFDLLGKEMRVIKSGPVKPGSFEAAFHTDGLPSGNYVIMARIGERVFTRTITVVR